MSYDFTKATDLVKWAKVQLENPNYYKNGGIGRYDGKYRTFDCCGLFKCFMWHDYSTSNAKYYNKTQKDLNCEGLIAEAKEKGTIDTMPNIPGILVYQKGHMGIHIGDGEVIESTAMKYDGKQGKIYKTYFKGNHKGYKRDTWTHWFKSPYLVYEEIDKTPITLKYKKGDQVVLNGSLYKDSKGNGKGKTLSDYVGTITITNNDYNTTKPYHIDSLGWVSESDLVLYVKDITEPEKPAETPNDSYYEQIESNNPLFWLVDEIIKILQKFVALFRKKE